MTHWAFIQADVDDTVDLLWDGAAAAKEVTAKAAPAMTRNAYVEFQRGVRRREVYRGV